MISLKPMSFSNHTFLSLPTPTSEDSHNSLSKGPLPATQMPGSLPPERTKNSSWRSPGLSGSNDQNPRLSVTFHEQKYWLYKWGSL